MGKTKPDEERVFDYPMRLRYRGTYDYDGLLALIRSYYDEVQIDARMEPKFKYKVGGTGAEVEFKMFGDRKITHYIRMNLIITGHMWDVKRKEVEVNGKKKLLTDGKLEIVLDANYELNFAVEHGKGFDTANSSSHKWMKKFLDEKDEGLQFQDTKVTGKKFTQHILYVLLERIKKHLNMDCYK